MFDKHLHLLLKPDNAVAVVRLSGFPLFIWWTVHVEVFSTLIYPCRAHFVLSGRTFCSAAKSRHRWNIDL